MGSDKPRGTQDLLQQFRELGQELERSIRRAWESDEGQEVREQVSNGINELSHQLNRLVDEVERSQTYKNVRTKVKDTIESPQVEETAQNIQRGLGDALVTLNDQLNKLIEALPVGKSDKK